MSATTLSITFHALNRPSNRGQYSPALPANCNSSMKIFKINNLQNPHYFLTKSFSVYQISIAFCPKCFSKPYLFLPLPGRTSGLSASAGFRFLPASFLLLKFSFGGRQALLASWWWSVCAVGWIYLGEILNQNRNLSGVVFWNSRGSERLLVRNEFRIIGCEIFGRSFKGIRRRLLGLVD